MNLIDARIRATAIGHMDDPEAAHAEHDDLMADVLKAVAEHSTDPALVILAGIALKATPPSRHCA